jgi:hypothetical protein
LDHPVSNQNEIALFINFVRQEPTTAYTASGTTLTLTSATSGSDDMYCIYLGKAVQTVNPPNGSVGLSQLSATGTKDATTFLRGDNTFAVAGGDNTPAVSAYSNANQTVTDNTSTKVAFNAEIYDTDSAFDTSTYRFTVPSGKAGKYFIYTSIYMYGNNNDERLRAIDIQLNGGIVRRFEAFGDSGTGFSNGGNISGGAVLNLSVGDYIEIFGKLDVNSGTPSFYGASAATNRYTILEIFKLVE